jgi:hypothetical protein
VARTYAGILGSLALVITLARGVLAGGGVDAVLWTGCSHLAIFAAIGAAVGWVAEQIVADAVHGRIAAKLAQRKAAPAGPPAKAAAVGR